jgi:hypothetical protein
MIKTVEQLKQERPDLVELFESMDREQLLNQIYLEVIDAVNMEKRVEVFMELCAPNMSYTTYTEGSIRSMVQTQKEIEISQFCEMALEDIEGMNAEEIRNYLREEVR